MKKSNTLSKNDEIGVVIIVAIMYILFMFLLKYVSSLPNPNGIAGITVRGSEICGVISQIPIQLCIWMTISCRRYGYYTSLALFLYQVTVLSISLARFGTSGFYPGVFTVLTGAIICTILRKYLLDIEKNDKRLFTAANTDELTGLPNRRALMTKMDALTASRAHFALAFIDIDNFKLINDTYSHDDGDKVLAEISSRWSSLLNEKDFIARLGGDEFALIIGDFSSKEDLMKRINVYAKALDQKIAVSNRFHFISASFGVVICPDNASETMQLLRYADTAMYSTKNHCGTHITMFNTDMEEIIVKSAEIESDIRYALENDGFYVVYQPQFSADRKCLRGFEALARMHGRNGEVVSPGRFIPVAEKNGLISKVENVIFSKALNGFKSHADRHRGKFLLALNISAIHLQEENFLSDVWSIINSTDFPTECLEIEITESVLIAAVSQSIEKLNSLKKIGIRLALDDFGTGYASLNYLRKLPVDILKVDKCFVDNIASTGEEAEFVDAIISMGHMLHYSVLSEGVETEAQLEILRKFNCDHIQGYLWGTPLEYADACDLLDSLMIEKSAG